MSNHTKQHNWVELRLSPAEVQHLARLLLLQNKHRMRKIEKLEKRAEGPSCTPNCKKGAERLRKGIQLNQALFSKLVSTNHLYNFAE